MVSAYDIIAAVTDPEIPVLTIADLGILREVIETEKGLEVTITPTYSGCPAMMVLALDIELALAKHGFPKPIIKQTLSPAWTTDWMTVEGKAKLLDYGIAPPVGKGKGSLFMDEVVACPQCRSANTEKLSEFGSTACKALWRCKACQEPFDYFKCI